MSTPSGATRKGSHRALQLPLHRLDSAERRTQSAPVTGADPVPVPSMSLSTGALGGRGTEGAVVCPLGHGSKDVHRARYWDSQEAWIWQCSHVGILDQPRSFCGHQWVTGRPLAVCTTCLGALRIRESANGLWAYWCNACQDYSD